MRSGRYIFAILMTFIAEAAAVLFFYGRIDTVRQDTVAVNECVKSIESNYGDPSSYSGDLKYVLIDNDGEVLYRTEEGLSESINEAVKNNDTILDITVNGEVAGKVIIHNSISEKVSSYKSRIILFVLVISFVQIMIIICYYLHIKRRITDPFAGMNDFAVRIAGGDLDTPLEVDRKHVFGEFTEAFDLMRSELKKARASEKKANDDKKELVAKLSHDIKTPVASIKSASEIGYELSKDEKAKEYFNQINVKADQITVLVENLFTASVAEETGISVSPSSYDSSILENIIRTSDHLKKARDFKVPQCRIYVDKLRIAQVFDNIFMNSYKYADTPIEVITELTDMYLKVKVADKGPGVKDEELGLLKEKYRRGEGSHDKDGAGLGLYISDGFMNAMEGRLILENLHPGFAVTVCIRTL